MQSLAQLNHDQCIAEAEASEAWAKSHRLAAAITLHPDQIGNAANAAERAKILAKLAETADASAFGFRKLASEWAQQVGKVQAVGP